MYLCVKQHPVALHRDLYIVSFLATLVFCTLTCILHCILWSAQITNCYFKTATFILCSVYVQVNSVNCNTSWKIVLFMKWSDNKEVILKGVWTVKILSTFIFKMSGSCFFTTYELT